MATEKKFLLIAIGLGQNKIVKEGGIKVVQSEKTRLQKEAAWKKYIFQVRTPEGYAAIKVYDPKNKKDKK